MMQEISKLKGKNTNIKKYIACYAKHCALPIVYNQMHRKQKLLSFKTRFTTMTRRVCHICIFYILDIIPL